jgi:enterochelin esterase-like enzyme
MASAEIAVPTRPRAARAGLVALLLAFLAVGAVGLWRYLDGFWLYRAFAPPRDPAFVTTPGTVQRLYVASPALGGRRQPVDVYLPPGYDASAPRRYPVFYLLHGFPGRPGAFLQTVRAGVDEDVLVAERRMRPLILVMPVGTTGTCADPEWPDGVRPHEGWETFVARDVVRAIDARYRTIPAAGGRAIGGLSEGGYGALDIALHHPGEFRVAESWSGYELADPIPSIFGGNRALLVRDSPLLELPRVAPALRRSHVYFWLYSGAGDDRKSKLQNRAFAAELARAHVPHRFALIRGGHNWAVWRSHAPAALLAASARLAGS